MKYLIAALGLLFIAAIPLPTGFIADKLCEDNQSCAVGNISELINGSAIIERGKDKIRASVNDYLQEGDVLSIEAGTVARISIDNEGTLTLQGPTEFEVPQRGIVGKIKQWWNAFIGFMTGDCYVMTNLGKAYYECEEGRSEKIFDQLLTNTSE